MPEEAAVPSGDSSVECVPQRATCVRGGASHSGSLIDRLKYLLACVATLGVGALLMLSTPAAWAGARRGSVMVMQHVCRSTDIQTESDIVSIEERGDGGEVGAAARRIMACPAVSLPGDRPSRGLAGKPVRFDYRVTGADGRSQTLADARHARATLCELDIAFDANGDGRWSEDFCLDNSHYIFENVAMGPVTIRQRVPPRGTRFGALRFTPVELGGNNDRDTLEGYAGGRINLNLSADRDRMVMLHIYNFQGHSPANRMLDSSTATNDRTGAALLPAWLFCLVFGAGGALCAAARFRRSGSEPR